MAITSVTKDGDDISYVEDGATKKVSVSGSDAIVSFPISSCDRIINVWRQQSDGHLIVTYIDTNGDEQTIDFNPSGGGVTDHGALTGLSDDDHSQYWNGARGVVGVKTVKLDDLTAPDDNTDLDFSTTKHGLVPKGTNIGNFLKDDGSWGSPAGGGDMLAATYDPQSIAADAFDCDQHTDGLTNGVYTLTERTKLAAIEAGATADQSGAEIKAAYEAEADTNAFDDAAVSKLAGIEAAADVTDAANVASAGALMVANLENPPTEDEASKAPTSEWAFDHNARDATAAQQGHATAAQITKLDGIAAGADVTGDNAPQAHKDSHDPEGGSDALDCAAAGEIAGVAAAAEGSAHSYARSDHTHQIQHAITDNHVVTIDGSPNSGEVTVWTANGIDGKTYAEFHALQFASALPEDVAIILDDALSADGKYCVTMALNGTAGTNLAFGDCVYFAVADSKWELARGNAEATVSPMTGIVISAGVEDAAIVVAIIGEIRADAAFPALTVGAPVFIDPDTAGDVTSTELTTGEYQKAIGWAKTANSIVLTGNPDWVKVG